MNDTQEKKKLFNFYKLRKKMNIILRSSFMFLIVASSLFGIVGCSNTQSESFDGNSNGAYFITDDSYQKITATIPQSAFRCIIVGDKMMLSGVENNVYYVYDIVTESDTSFKGTSIMGDISCWFDGNTLCIDYGGQTIQFKEDKSYILVEDEAIILTSPQNIEVSSGADGLGFVMFQWNYQSDYGKFGATVEIKTANAQEFQPVKKVERVYMNMFTVQLDCSNFEIGENYVRLYHIGAPDITNDKSIKVYENSDYAIYCVIVDESGKVTVR